MEHVQSTYVNGCSQKIRVLPTRCPRTLLDGRDAAGLPMRLRTPGLAYSSPASVVLTSKKQEGHCRISFPTAVLWSLGLPIVAQHPGLPPCCLPACTLHGLILEDA